MRRHCDRPACPQPAAATLHFRYADRAATLEPLDPDAPPQTYDLCPAHAASTRPPHGWTLLDLRTDEAQGIGDARSPAPGALAGSSVGRGSGLGGRDTVALLAAALHSAADRSAVSAAATASGVTSGSGD